MWGFSWIDAVTFSKQNEYGIVPWNIVGLNKELAIYMPNDTPSELSYYSLCTEFNYFILIQIELEVY